MEYIFFVDNRIGGEAVCNLWDWRTFVYYEYPPKASVRWLEPFVARYIKAISACGVSTWLSCDGNISPSHNEIVIGMDGKPNKLWHKIICERCLASRFNLRWNSTFEKIRFSEKSKWRTYIELNRAAEYLYDNREKLRGIKWKATEGISTSMAVHLSDEELAKLFIDRVNEQEFPD